MNRYCFFGDFYWKSKVPLVGDFRAVQRVDSYGVATPFLDEGSFTELPHTVQTASFSGRALLIFLTSLYFCSPISMLPSLPVPPHWIYCKKWSFWLCVISSAYYIFVACLKWSAHRHMDEFRCNTLSVSGRCELVLAEKRQRSIISALCSFLVAECLHNLWNCALPPHSGIQNFAPKICATLWKTLFFGCLGHSKPP